MPKHWGAPMINILGYYRRIPHSDILYITYMSYVLYNPIQYVGTWKPAVISDYEQPSEIYQKIASLRSVLAEYMVVSMCKQYFIAAFEHIL